MSHGTTYLFFAACAPGLEALLRDELNGMGVHSRVETGGIEFRGSEQTLYRICLESRLAESVRLRMKSCVARDFDGLMQGVKRLPFRAFLAQGAPIRLRVVCHKSRLFHSGAVAERVLLALRDHAGLVPSESEDAQLIHVRLDQDDVQLSLDASGERMHRRGYRTHVGEASLRETLAAALLRATASLPDVAAKQSPAVLWDPFCGAGTIVLEALHQTNRCAGEARQHSFQTWRVFAPGAFDLFRDAHKEQRALGGMQSALRVIGSDHSEKVLKAARENGKNAGFGDELTLLCGDVELISAQVPPGAYVVTNPPYGKRLADAQAVHKLLRVLKKRPDLRPAVALVGGSARAAVPTECPALFTTKNGGFSVSARLLTKSL